MESKSKTTGKTASRPEAGETAGGDALEIPVVGVGASAGGLEALEALFKCMPEDTGAAFVLILHLAPDHVSLLPELLQKHTRMPVVVAVDGARVEPDRIYVIPPSRELKILGGKLQLLDLPKRRGLTLPIDSFFHSLALDQGAKAISIVLSGTGSDGTMGAKAIKHALGMVMVQDEVSAKYDGMPRSVITSGMADYVLPPEKMPEQLLRFIRHASVHPAPGVPPAFDPGAKELQKVFVILRARTDHDFSLYKKNTICRRIERRMNVHQISEMPDYIRYLQESEREADILFKELLIGVTSFFRDPKAFLKLQDQILPQRLSGKPQDEPFRVWVPGCATGEEAYTIAIVLLECMERLGRHWHVQIFGTDIDQSAIDVARAGCYLPSALADIGPERLRRFFTREESGSFRVKKHVREMLVFAPQNVIKDPPFTKLDLLSCRNLLIYLGPELQQRLLPIFHYSLRPDGILFLGSSETIGSFNDLFGAADKKWKLFRRRSVPGANRPSLTMPSQEKTPESLPPPTTGPLPPGDDLSSLHLVETVLRESDTPPCAVIDDAGNAVYIHGRTGRYLEPAEGRANTNLIEMARPGLKQKLAGAIRGVASSKQRILLRGLDVDGDAGRFHVNVTVIPVLERTLRPGLMMVVFEETDSPSKTGKSDAKPESTKSTADTRTVESLEQDLQHTRESLQTTIEELETSNEELKSTNEELQSTNEELQSTNEELETSKEELQSLNEESATVNAELQSRIDELSQTNDDMKNLLDSTDIATLFLDNELRIRRFTPKATAIIPLTSGDVGRPIRHLATELEAVDLEGFGRKVIDDLGIREMAVNTRDQHHFYMRVRPYRTVTNVIDGVVYTFEETTGRKRIEDALRNAELRFRTLFELAKDPIFLIDSELGRIVEFNQCAHDQLGYTREEFADMTLRDLSASAEGDDLTSLLTGDDGSSKTCLRDKDGVSCEVRVHGRKVLIDDREHLLCTWQHVNE